MSRPIHQTSPSAHLLSRLDPTRSLETVPDPYQTARTFSTSIEECSCGHPTPENHHLILIPTPTPHAVPARVKWLDGLQEQCPRRAALVHRWRPLTRNCRAAKSLPPAVIIRAARPSCKLDGRLAKG